VFLKTTVSRASKGGKIRYCTIVKSVRRNGVPRHEPVHDLGVLTDAEAQGVRNALEAAKNPGAVSADPYTISARDTMGSYTSWSRIGYTCHLPSTSRWAAYAVRSWTRPS
jgi:hypothetical protein